MRFYEVTFKEEVAKYCDENGINKAVRKYDLAYSMINNWTKKYQNGESLEYRRKAYTDEFKDKVVNESRNTSFEKVAKKYDLNLGTLKTWRYAYGNEEEVKEEIPEVKGGRWVSIDGLNGYYK